MDIEQMLQIANSAMFAHNGRRLSEVEAAILLGSMQHQSYEHIAEASGYAVSYLQHDVGPKFWKLLGQALGETVSKTNFRGALEHQRLTPLIGATQTQALAVEPTASPPATAGERLKTGESLIQQ